MSWKSALIALRCPAAIFSHIAWQTFHDEPANGSPVENLPLNNRRDAAHDAPRGRKGRQERPDSRDALNRWFRCLHCGQPVVPDGAGAQHRNHCNWCLWSRHLDDEPGDRAASDCGGAMEPVSVWARPGGDWAIIHRCRGCGTLHSNRIAGDDNELALVALAARALAQPPFPMSRITTLASTADRVPEEEQAR